jgi:hypothetical protein
MNRLPIVGSDIEQWGSILNGFLGVSHNSDGSLNATAIKNAGSIADVTLGSNSSVLTLPALVIPPTARVAILTAKAQVTGNTNGFQWEHVRLRVNADSTINHYGWSGVNSDITHVTSTVGTDTDSVLAGHAPSDSAPSGSGIIHCDFSFPSDGASVKAFTFDNLLVTSFTDYSSVIPLRWQGGGFWIGPGAITEITLFPASGQFTAGSRAILTFV